MLKAKVINDNEEQTVILPEEIRISGTDVCVKKCGGVIILIPAEQAVATSENDTEALT